MGRNRSNGFGGGVMIYIKKRISFKHRQDLQQHNSIENIFIEIIVKKSKSIIFGCFRPPDSSKYLSKYFNDLIRRESRQGS